MIYFDNAATSLIKPKEVGDAMILALNQAGNPGRSFHTPALQASRILLQARKEVANLVDCAIHHVAFTSGATESLNLALHSCLKAGDHVITSCLEHNSVLRPLYQIPCQLSFLEFTDSGDLVLDQLKQLLQPNTKAIVCTHGSNVLGNLVDISSLYEFCKKHQLLFILDVAQTLGQVPLKSNMADIICFTGHKSLLGPQGTGGIITAREDLNIVKTGGSGSQTFASSQAPIMPELFEVGTPNIPGLAGLTAGIKHIQQVGLPQIQSHEQNLCSYFMEGLARIGTYHIYGPKSIAKRLPVVSFLPVHSTCEEIAESLFDHYGIACRTGGHCAPLVHEKLGTIQSGLIRFSFSYSNTLDEIEQALLALTELARTERI